MRYSFLIDLFVYILKQNNYLVIQGKCKITQVHFVSFSKPYMDSVAQIDNFLHTGNLICIKI